MTILFSSVALIVSIVAVYIAFKIHIQHEQIRKTIMANQEKSGKEQADKDPKISIEKS